MKNLMTNEISRIVKAFTFSMLILLTGCAGGQSSLSGSGLDSSSVSNARWPITGTSADALAKGVLGGELARDLAKNDLKTALLNEREALDKGQTGAPVSWQGIKNTSGKIIPQQVFEVGSAQCRRYEHTITVSGKNRSATGTACKDTNGVWKPLV